MLRDLVSSVWEILLNKIVIVLKEEEKFATCNNYTAFLPCVQELDGVGPVDNRSSTDKLHHFVKKIKNKITRDM